MNRFDTFNAIIENLLVIDRELTTEEKALVRLWNGFNLEEEQQKRRSITLEEMQGVIHAESCFRDNPTG